jgi:hypothetical protein
MRAYIKGHTICINEVDIALRGLARVGKLNNLAIRQRQKRGFRVLPYENPLYSQGVEQNG